MKEETFVNQHGYGWMWFSLLLVVAMSAIYIWHDPIGGPSGGTVLGYTYGGIAAAGMVFLMWYAKRKRAAYHASHSTLKGWLGAHVWIGAAMLLIVPLHAGFSFGWNVHTLAYVLMVLTIVTGIYGAVMYVKLPHAMKARRDGITLKACLDQIELISNDMADLASDKSDKFAKMLNAIDFSYEPHAMKAVFGSKIKEVDKKTISSHLSELDRTEYEHGLKLIGLAHRKTQICNQMSEEARVAALLKVWLYFHLPISVAAFITLLIHILSVFYYW